MSTNDSRVTKLPSSDSAVKERSCRRVFAVAVLSSAVWQDLVVKEGCDQCETERRPRFLKSASSTSAASMQHHRGIVPYHLSPTSRLTNASCRCLSEAVAKRQHQAVPNAYSSAILGQHWRLVDDPRRIVVDAMTAHELEYT